MLAQKQIERAAQATEQASCTSHTNTAATNYAQAEDKTALPPRSIQTEQEILLLYEIVGTHGTASDLVKLLDSSVFSPVEQLKQGRKEPLMYTMGKLESDENWQTLYGVCRDCLSVTDDGGELTLQASDWDVWQSFIVAASQIRDSDAE